jgi:hypothetical protein
MNCLLLEAIAALPSDAGSKTPSVGQTTSSARREDRKRWFCSEEEAKAAPSLGARSALRLRRSPPVWHERSFRKMAKFGGLNVDTLFRWRAKKKRLKIAPFIGIGCPGVIEEEKAPA